MERLYDIDRRIRSKEFPSISELSHAWEVAERTIKRDIAFLKDRWNAPLEYDRNKKGYYYTEPSWAIPSIPLKQGDLFSLLIARHALAQYKDLPITNKLEQVYTHLTEALGEQTSIDPEEILSEFSFVAPPAIPVDPLLWESVCQSVLQRRTIEMGYQSKRATGKRTHRIDPYHIANIHGDWYVFAYNHHYKAIRQFAIGRILEVTETGETFRRPHDFDPVELVESSFGGFASMDDMKEVCIRISNQWSLEVKDRQWHAKQKIRELKNGDIEVTFRVSASGQRPYFNVIQWVLGMGKHARVIRPAKLKQLVAEEIHAMAELSCR